MKTASSPGDVEAPVSTSALDHLIQNNRRWAAQKTLRDQGFFHRLARQQSPRYFWIGCSDSRVPATEIVDLDPGQMFVHRNVANLARLGDPNFGAALHFAVHALKVRHIIVVGHYGCGGVSAAMTAPGDNVVDRWVEPVRELASRHAESLTSLGAVERHDRLCELNVCSQVQRVASHPVVVEAWRTGQRLTIHGWIYSIENGLLDAISVEVSEPSRERTFFPGPPDAPQCAQQRLSRA